MKKIRKLTAAVLAGTFLVTGAALAGPAGAEEDAATDAATAANTDAATAANTDAAAAANADAAANTDAAAAANTDAATAANTDADAAANTNTEAGVDAELEVVFLNVGKADAILLMTESSTVLIDAGLNDGGYTVLSFLEERGIDHLDLMIITHYDKDHVGGADIVVEEIPVEQVYLPVYESDSSQYLEFMAALESTQTPYERLTENLSFSLDGADYTIDVANKTDYGENEENDFSLVTGVQYGQVSLLFAGDAENPRLKELLKEGIGHYDVLKVPHHGRLEKKSDEFLEAVSPSYAVITSSLEELEEEELVTLLQSAGTEIYLTREGDVYCVTDGSTITFTQDIAENVSEDIAENVSQDIAENVSQDTAE